MEKLKNDFFTQKEPEIPVNLGGLKTSIRFVETHFYDIKTILKEMGILPML